MATATHADPSPSLSIADNLGPRPEEVDPIIPPPGDVFYEVVDGEVMEVPPMGTFEADIANLLAEMMNEYARPRASGRAFVEVLFRIDAGREIRRQPDVAFVSASRWPAGKRAPKASSWQVVPDIAVEVVSPSDLAVDLNRKIDDYFRAGVVHCWVIYPGTQQVYVYTSPTNVLILTPPDELDGGDVLPGFRIALDRLFNDDPDATAPDQT